MNSLLEIVLWGAPAVLLSWGLLLALACVVVFHGSATQGQTSAQWGSAGVKRLDRE
jgi:hypothetical protein